MAEQPKKKGWLARNKTGRGGIVMGAIFGAVLETGAIATGIGSIFILWLIIFLLGLPVYYRWHPFRDPNKTFSAGASLAVIIIGLVFELVLIILFHHKAY